MNEKYLLFHIVGHDGMGQNPLNSTPDFKNKVVIRLISETYEDALSRAKNIIKREEWLLAEVVEYAAKATQ